MALFSSKSKDWLDTLEIVNRLLKEDPNRTGASLANELGISPAQVSNFTTLNGCLDQAAMDKIRTAKPYNFSLNSALALAGLKKPKRVTFPPPSILLWTLPFPAACLPCR